MNLVYVGRIVELEPIVGADFIDAACVVCGEGGKWHGVVKKGMFKKGDLCTCFMPDCVLPDDEKFKFMEKHSHRVKMCRFRGVASEVLIMPYEMGKIGDDISDKFAVTKYQKELPQTINGKACNTFPPYIIKTDERHYQNVMDWVDILDCEDCYITEKLDGTSCTVFNYRGKFGVCSRNFELAEGDDVYWQMARKYNLHLLEVGFAVQFEIVGPKINKNSYGSDDYQAFCFNVYDINKERYLEFHEMVSFLLKLNFPMVKVLYNGRFYKDEVDLLGEGTYENGKQREGVVVRSKENMLGYKPISFKVINLNYE